MAKPVSKITKDFSFYLIDIKSPLVWQDWRAFILNKLQPLIMQYVFIKALNC